MSEVKKCPECVGEMEKGYVQLMERIRWRTEENRRGSFSAGEGLFGLAVMGDTSVESVTIFSSIIGEGVKP